jgi:phosphonate transport system ATP-binding protein
LGIFLPIEFARAKECLTQVNLLPCAWKRTGDLSGGQQQRGAIARALIQEAKIILADEPIASLDPAAAEEVMILLRNLNQTRNITMLISLHQIDFALRFCNRAIVLHEGKITYDGPTAGLSQSRIDSFYKNKPDDQDVLLRKLR